MKSVMKLLLIQSCILLLVACGSKEEKSSAGKNTTKSGKSTAKSKKGSSEADMAKMGETMVDGFEKYQAFRKMGRMGSIGYYGKTANDKGVNTRVAVSIMECTPMCLSMDEKGAGLAKKRSEMMFSKKLKESPSTKVESSVVDVAGKKALMVNSYGFVKLDKGTASSNVVEVILTNGKMEVKIQATPGKKQRMVFSKSEEEHKAQISKADLEKAAKTVAAAFAKQI